MNPGPSARVQFIVESICGLGCDRVREIIQTLEAGESVSETSGLADAQQQLVLAELQAIMSVYDKDPR
jgi:hypothetical protein